MSAFTDATCQKCKRRFGWAGEIVNQPSCPACGDVVPKEELEKLQAKIDEAMKEIFKDK